MYEIHWGLEQAPFRGLAEVEAHQECPSFCEALARLHYLADHNRRVGLLVGEGGSGKSLLLSTYAHQVAKHGWSVASVNLTGLEIDELLWSVAAQLGVNPHIDESRHRLWRAVVDRLTEHDYRKQRTVLLFDDADEASTELLIQVIRLIQANSSPAAMLTVVLAADARHVDLLGPRLLGLCDLKIELERWNEEDTAAFVESCLSRAGREHPVFQPSATSRLHELAGGVPRRISQLAELSLLAGAGQRLSQIDPQTVESAYMELDVVGSLR